MALCPNQTLLAPPGNYWVLFENITIHILLFTFYFYCSANYCIFLIMEPFLCMLLVFLFTLVWQVCPKFVYEIFSNFIVLSVKIFFLVVHFVGWLFYFKVNSNRSDCPILVPIWFSFLEPKSTKPNCNFFATFSRWTPSNFRFCVFCPKTWKNTFSR